MEAYDKSPFPTRADSIEAGNLLVSRFESPITHDVILHEESLRDGEQTVGVAFSAEAKIDLARRLLAAGVRYMSLGFPAVFEDECEVARTIVKEAPDPNALTCLARAREEDVRAVLACGIPEISMFIAISDLHLDTKLRMTEEAAYRQMVDQIQFARSVGLRVRFGFEDASRAPLERIKRFSTGAMEAGAHRIALCDTCGVLTPGAAYGFIREMAQEIGGHSIAVHFHNDLGMATANTLSALSAGARMAQTTIAGIGERAGNTSTEELVIALRVKYGIDLGIDLAQLLPLSAHVRELVGFPTVPNEPIVGSYAFAHESGIHVGGIMREAANYEPFPPALLGIDHSVWFGKHAGVSNIRHVAKRMEMELSDDKAHAVLAEVKRRAVASERVDESMVRGLLEAEGA